MFASFSDIHIYAQLPWYTYIETMTHPILGALYFKSALQA